MRSIPDSPEALQELARADRIRVTKSDGSVQLRLEGIDTPETHFGQFAQPLGDSHAIGCLSAPALTTSRLTVRARSLRRRRRPVRRWCSARPLIPTSAPISYLLVDHDDPPPDGQFAEVDGELLRSTVNAASLAEGVAYLTLYSSTPARHRRTLRAIAADASQQQLGVWGPDNQPVYHLRRREPVQRVRGRPGVARRARAQSARH